MRTIYLFLVLTLLLGISLCSSCTDNKPTAEASAVVSQTDSPEAAVDDVFTLPPDKPVDVKLEFAKASHNGKPGQLSDLEFTVVAECEEQELKSESFSLNAEKPQDTSMLDLNEFEIEVRPIIDSPVNLDKGTYGAYGGYRIAVRNAEGKSLCCLEVNKKGELQLLGAECSDYMPYQSLAVPTETKWRYTIYPRGEGVKREALLAVAYTGDGFANQDINDAAGNHYTYRFPNATLTIYNSKLAAELKDEIAAEQAAYMGSGGGASCGSGG